MRNQLLALIERYKQLGIDSQIDYNKFYLYSIITHSTAIEGSTVTEIENQLLFDEGITAKGKPLMEQMMNLDLKRAYEESIRLAKNHTDITIDTLKALSHLVMQNTGSTYKTALGDFSSANGDLRMVNVTAGVGGRSYLSYQKVPAKLQEFCDWLNAQRKRPMSLSERYDFSFEAHYRLVTIHPWADGNGRMARLVMNHIQFESGLIPAKVLKEDKGGMLIQSVVTMGIARFVIKWGNYPIWIADIILCIFIGFMFENIFCLKLQLVERLNSFYCWLYDTERPYLGSYAFLFSITQIMLLVLYPLGSRCWFKFLNHGDSN